VFGGASREHALRLALVELSALPALVFGLLALADGDSLRRHRFALALLGSVFLIPLLQLLPLPLSTWSGLPGREQAALALEIAGLAPAWLPISLTPDLTWLSLLALIPPAAMFLVVLRQGFPLGERLIRVALGFAVLSILLAFGQAIIGTRDLFVWAANDVGEVPGLFANRNHLATLCLISLPFACVLGARPLRESGRDQKPLWLAALFVFMVVLALGVIRSRAGVVLMGPVLAVSLAAGWLASGRGLPRRRLVAGAGLAAVSLLVVAAFLALPVVDRFDPSTSSELRFENWPLVLRAADAHLPLGGGIGSFDAVFRSVEPLSQLDATFFNHAHNDYLETLLEAGWLGAAAIVGFLVWFGRRGWRAWRSGAGRAHDLQRAASVAILVMLLHSAADYPLRTETLMVLFALFAALLELQPTSLRRRSRSADD